MVADKVAGRAGGGWRGLLLALLLALWLQSLPWRGVALALRPDFLLVLVLYASLYRPALAGMGWAFAIGLLSDFQEGVVFGQHATAYVSGVYVVQLLRLRLLMFDPLRQAIQLLPVFLLVQLVLLLIGWLAAAPPAGWAILLPVFSSAAVWYGLAMLMQLWHGKGARHD